MSVLPSLPLVRRHEPRHRSQYQRYRNCLRLDFTFRCAYCGTSELEVKPATPYGGFEIDHFRPWKKFRDKKLLTSYPNLYWSCRLCNNAKGEYWPTPAEFKGGYRIVDPCQEPLSSHLRLSGHELVARTRAGEYTIEVLRLNSAPHKQRRLEREVTRSLLQNLAVVAGDEQSEVVELLTNYLAPPKDYPWDAPRLCDLCVPPRA